jgi:hypothetical protein
MAGQRWTTICRSYGQAPREVATAASAVRRALEIRRLEFQVPLIERILLDGEAAQAIPRNVGERRGGLPGLNQCSFDRVSRGLEVDQEIGMRAVNAIRGLAGGHWQGLLNQLDVEA